MPETITRNLPVLALRGVTAFPRQTVSFDVEREISIFALDNAMENDRRIFCVTQKELSTSAPGESDLYNVGTVCHILQIIKTSDTSVRVVVEGECRARLARLWQTQPFLQGQAELLPEQLPRHTERSAHTECPEIFHSALLLPDRTQFHKMRHRRDGLLL